MNAACAGPRRPSIDDLADRLRRRSPSIAASVVSVGASSSGVSASIRATSTRDVAVPDHDRALAARGRTRGPGSRGGRCTRRRTRWRATSRGDPRRGSRAAGRSARRPRRRRRRRARASSSWEMSRPTSTLPRKRKPGCGGDLLERARDRLDLRVVGRDAEAHEPPRRRQPLDQVDLDAGRRREQRARGVEAGGAGADDGDAKGRHRRPRSLRSSLTRCAVRARRAGLSARSRSRSRRSSVPSGELLALLDLERVAAAARGDRVRVVDLEPGLLEAVSGSRSSRPRGTGR